MSSFKNKTVAVLSIATIFLTSACSSEEFGNKKEGTGELSISLSNGTSFAIPTGRAVNENEYRNTSNYTVQVINSNDNTVMECKGSELYTKIPITLEGGSYTIKAFYGTSSAASRNAFYVEGTDIISIKANQSQQVAVNCLPTCGKVLVAFDSAMGTYYDEYNVEFKTKALASASALWNKTDTEPWYLQLEPAGEIITYTINLTAKSDYINGNGQDRATVTGTFNLKRNEAHKLTIKPNYTPQTTGGLGLTIEIDESTEDHQISFEVPVSWV